MQIFFSICPEGALLPLVVDFYEVRNSKLSFKQGRIVWSLTYLKAVQCIRSKFFCLFARHCAHKKEDLCLKFSQREKVI